MKHINHPDKIAIITIPTSGHVHVLAKMARDIKKDLAHLYIKWIITSWPDYEINPKVKEIISSIGDEVIILHGNTPQGLAIFERTYELTDEIIEQCRGYHYLVYDFLSPEGYIAGKALTIPAICTLPAIIGPFEPDDSDYQNALKKSERVIQQLENKYAVKLKDKIQYISAALSIQSDDLNLIFSWPNLINIGQFRRNRESYTYEFMRSCLPAAINMSEIQFLLDTISPEKKIIYFSLGTIAASINNNDLTDFFIYLYDCLIKDFGANDNIASNYELILSFGDKTNQISSLRQVPSNFHIHSYIPQEALLQSGRIDAFITHGGGNSTNEAIDSSVPMIVIPLMFDQHLCAENISKSGIGIHFPYIGNEKPYFRESLHPGALKNAVNDIISLSMYDQNIEKLRSVKPLPFTSLQNLLINNRFDRNTSSAANS